MATFNKLREELRESKLVEVPTDFYGDATLMQWLEDASREIAAAFRFPRRSEVIPVTAGTSEVALNETPIDVMSVTFEGVGLARRGFSYVRFYQHLLTERWPRAWFYEPFSGGSIQIGPAPSVPGDFDVRYIGSLYLTPVTGTTEVWEGLFPAFHELVLLRAAMKAFEKGYNFDESMYYLGRYRQQLQEFAQFMGISPPPVELQGEAQS